MKFSDHDTDHFAVAGGEQWFARITRIKRTIDHKVLH